MKCSTCRDKDAELLTRWERARNWLFLRVNHALFPQDFDDLKSEKYTQGYSDGHDAGCVAERRSYARMKELYNPTPEVPIEDYVEKRMIELLSPIDPNKVISFNTKIGKIYIGNEPATEAQLSNLKSEAEALCGFDLWPLLNESIKTLAERAMFVDGDNIETMRKGRSMLYTLSTQKKILDTVMSFRGVDKNPGH